METKQCRTCGLSKVLDLFHKSGFNANGEQYYRPDCKECHKPINKEHNSKYRQKHKDTIEARAGEKIPCECGLLIRRDWLSRHKLNLQHQEQISK